MSLSATLILYTIGWTTPTVALMSPSPEKPAPASPPAPKKASLLRVIWIVISGFFMIGRNRDYGPDAPKITPAQLVIVAVIGGVLFVVGLVTLVSFITRQ